MISSTTAEPVDHKKFFEGSTKEGDHRVFGDAARQMMLKSDEPIDDLVSATYSQNVEKIKTGMIIPTKSRSAKMAMILYEGIMKQRIPVLRDRLNAAEGNVARLAVIPWMFRCPHPTKAEVDAWLLKWPASLTAECEALAPGYNFAPYIINGDKPTNAVMFAIVMFK